MISQLVTKISLNNFQKSIAVIFGGTAFAQLITILVLPVLTRIYTPEDFSLLAVYAAVLGILLTVACLRFEIAIPLPEKSSVAVNLLVLSVISAAAFSVLIFLVVTFASEQVVQLINKPGLDEYLWIIPIGILMGGTYNALQYWAIREKQFGAVAKTRLMQSAGGASIQVLLGWLWGGAAGLVVGYIVNVGAGAVGLAKNFLRDNYSVIKEIKLKDLKDTFMRYQSFPRYSSIEALTNTAGIQLPIIIIAATLNSAEAGFLMLALKVMQAPMSFLGSAISQVYLSQAPEKKREGVLDQLTLSVLTSLLKLGIGPIIFVGIIGPELFGLIFGEKWVYAGVLVGWMVPWFVFQFMASPISMVMHVAEKQRSMLVLTVIGFVFRVGSVLVAVNFSRDLISEVYALSGGFFYFICFLVFARAANVTRNAVAYLLLSSLPIITGWIMLGIVFKIIVGEFGG